MKYAHYWERPKTISKHDFLQIVGDYLKCTVIMHDQVAATVSEDTLLIDGLTGSDRDDLFFDRKADDTLGSCKTQRLDYDLHVCVILLIAKARLRDHFHVSTDGTTEDWQEAIEVCRKMLGLNYSKFDVTENNKLRYSYWE